MDIAELSAYTDHLGLPVWVIVWLAERRSPPRDVQRQWPGNDCILRAISRSTWAELS